MQPHRLTVRGLLGSSRYVIPPYQREYEWDAERWHALWTDIGQLYDGNRGEAGPTQPQHFIGVIILEAGAAKPGAPNSFQVIDGQQRLVTLLALLAAVRDARLDEAGSSLASHHGLYWVRDDENKVAGKRLTAQEADQGALDSAMEGQWRSAYPHIESIASLGRKRVLNAYLYFRYCIWRGAESFSEETPLTVPIYRPNQRHLAAEPVWDQALAESASRASASVPHRTSIRLDDLDTIIRDWLLLFSIHIENGDEDGATVFDTMNARRTELEQWDFIRNSVFTRLAADRRESVFKAAWGPAQKSLLSTSYAGLRAVARDAFVYDYLIARGEAKHQGTINRNRGHKHFLNMLARRTQSVPPDDRPAAIEDIVTTDVLPASFAWSAAVGHTNTIKTSHGDIRLPDASQECIGAIMALSSGPPIPVVLHYVDGWARGQLSDSDLQARLSVLESYVARHVIAQTAMSPFRARFMQAMGSIAGDFSEPPLLSALAGTWISDATLRTAFTDLPAYGPIKPGQLAAIFRGIEIEISGLGGHPLNFGRGKAEYSVEHVYPRSCEVAPNAAWTTEFDSWKVSAKDRTAMSLLVHRFGNLTVVTNDANRRLKAAPFAKKREALAGKDPKNKIPVLGVSREIVSATKWTPAQINSRAKALASSAVKRWPSH